MAISLTFTSTSNKSDQQSYHSDSNSNKSRRSPATREEITLLRLSSGEACASLHLQLSASDYQSQESESFTSNRASFGGSSHLASHASENDSTESEAQDYHLTSQYHDSHLSHYSYDDMTLSNYDNQLTIEGDSNEQYFTNQPGVHYAATAPATENGFQASNNNVYALQTYSPATEMWTLQESRDERIRLGLPGGQETSLLDFDYDQTVITVASYNN